MRVTYLLALMVGLTCSGMTLTEFGPIYESQYKDGTSQQLHVAGTTISLILVIVYWRTLVPAIVCAMLTHHFIKPLIQARLYEMAVLAGTFVVVGGGLIPALVLLSSFGPACIGHYFYEGTDTLTWQFPLQSLAYDLLLWVRYMTGLVISV
jgi:hypothetical protein